LTVVRGLEQIPWVYDALCAVMERTGFGRLRRWLVAGARGRTLDLGAGTGRNLPLLPGGTRAVAVDPSRASLVRAGRRTPRVPRVVAAAEALPFRDGTFDTVLAGLVLCSVADPPRALAEVARVLAVDGRLRLLEHVRATTPWRGRLQDWIQPAWTRISGGCHPNRDTEAAVRHAGFVVEERHAESNLRRLSTRPPADVAARRERP
jgi:ubiquinone/menaquinone biosynthesis C-methylase UbiE